MKKTAARKGRRPSLAATIREANRGLRELDRKLQRLDISSPGAPARLLALAEEHRLLWNKRAERLGLPLLPDPDAPEDDEL